MLDNNFWHKYFEVYDFLNKLIPYQELVNIFCSQIDNNNKIIADIGSGTGNISIPLSKMGHTVYAIDFSQIGHQLHKAKFDSAITILHDITNRLPFDDNFFDVVISNNTLYTIKRSDRSKIFKEIYRIVKPGGIAVISNLTTSFSPIKIYLDHIKKSLKQYGTYKTIIECARLIIPTLKIFYYNYLIKKETAIGNYDFFKDGEQAQELTNVGFKKILVQHKIYADQADYICVIK